MSRRAARPRTEEPRPRGARRRRWLLATLVAIPALLATLVVALLAILYQPAGARFVIERLRAVLPGELTVDEIRGNAGARLDLRGVRYRQPAAAGEPGWELRVKRLQLRWRALALLRRTVSIRSLRLEDVELFLTAAAEEPAEPAPLPELRLPVTVGVGRAEIVGLRVLRPGAEPLVIERAALERLRVAPDGGPLRFRELAVTTEAWRVTAGGELRPTGAYPFTLEGDWEITIDLAPDDPTTRQRLWLRGSGPLRGDTARVELAHEVTAGAIGSGAPPPGAPGAAARQVLRGELRGEVLDPLRELRAEKLELEWDLARWPAEDPVLVTSPRGLLVADGPLDELALRLDATLEGPRVPRSEWRAEATLHELERLAAPSFRGALLGGEIAGRAAATFGDDASWSVALEADGIDPSGLAPEWPGRLAFDLEASGQSAASSIALAVESLRGELRGYPVTAAAQIELAPETLRIERLDARSGDARLTASGTLGETRTIDFELDAPDLRALHPDVAGALRASGRLQGTASRPELAASFAGTELRFGDRTAGAATGELRVGLWQEGPTELALEVENLVLPELQQLSRLDRVEIDLGGTRGAHLLELEARGGDVGVAAGARGALVLAPEGFAFEQWTGTVQRLLFDSSDPDRAVDASAADVTAAELASPDLRFGRWELLEPGMALVIEPGAARVGPATEGVASAGPDAGERRLACLGELPRSGAPRADAGRLCLGGTWRTEAAWRLDAELDALPLALLGPWLPTGWSLEGGTATGTASVEGDGARLDVAQLQIVEAATRLRIERTYENSGENSDQSHDESSELSVFELEVLGFTGAGRLDPSGLSTVMQAQLEDGAAIDVELALAGYSLGAAAGTQPVRGRVRASLPQLARFSSVVPALQLASGRLESDLALSGTIDSPGLDGRVEVRDLRARFVGLVLTPGAEPMDITLSTPEMVARTTSSGATIDSVVRLEEPAGSVRVAVELPGYAPLAGRPWLEQPLAGTIDGELESLEALAHLLPRLTHTKGRLGAALRLGGTLGEAEVGGSIELADFSADVPDYGLELRDGKLTAEGRLGESLELTGSLRSGPGTLDIAGTVRAAAGEVAAELTFRGDDVAVWNTPEVRIRADPDLTLRAEGGTLALAGEVAFPWARIELRELPPSVVRPSPDVTVVRAVEPGESLADPAAAENTLAMSGRVRVRFGEEFRFRGFGFETEPSGSLLVTVPQRGQTTATGQLRLDGGVYRAYGQNLEIETGRVIFGGGPIANPGLDVTAYRTVGTVRAGVVVGGTLERPVLDLVANRPMSETEILHYVVLGRAPGETTEAEGDVLTRAATALSLRAGNQIARNLAARYGFDELRLEGGLDDASLVIGRFLSPRLYVSYGIGLFEPISTFTVRYVLTEHLTLVADTGRGTGATLEYEVEMGKARRPPEP